MAKRFWIGAALTAAILGGCSTAGTPPAAPVPATPRLSEEQVSAAEEARATAQLAEAQAAFDAEAFDRARQLAEGIVQDMPGTSASVPALWLAAQAAARLGDEEAAIGYAERYAAVPGVDATSADQARALIASARTAIATRPTGVLGVILPRTGSPALQQYSELILQGVRIAVDRYNAERDGSVELVVLDDAGNADQAAAQLRELERRRAFGVIGPLLAPSVAAAARARSDDRLAIVSPIADMTSWGLPRVFSLSSLDTRGAEVLAEHALSVGLRRVGLLYPNTEAFRRQARAFAEALSRGGGQIVADVPYDSATTTFAEPLGRLLAVQPQALYIPAPERDVQQLAPQLIYYGLAGQGLQILGGEAWANDDLLRIMDARHVEGVVAATPFYRDGDALAWAEFVEQYERTHRRALDNAVPALGYDAARLLLTALEGDPRPAGVAERIEAIAGFRSATGVLSVRDGEVQRTPFLVRIQARELVPIRVSTGS